MLKPMLDVFAGSGLTISVQLGEFSRAVSVTTLTKMVRRLDDVQADLRQVQALTVNLRSNAEKLNAGNAFLSRSAYFNIIFLGK